MTIGYNGIKCALSKRLDRHLNRRISREFRRRIKRPEGAGKDHRLCNFLEKQNDYRDIDKIVTLNDLKKEAFSLYVEVLIDFLKSQGIVPLMTVDRNAKDKGYLVCKVISEKRPIIMDYTKYPFYKDYTRFVIIVPSRNESREIDYITQFIAPPIEAKVRDIVEFVVDKNALEPVFEAAKTVRRKTIEERRHTRDDGRKFIEWDIYSYTQYLGQEYGRCLVGDEKSIRTRFALYNPELGENGGTASWFTANPYE